MTENVEFQGPYNYLDWKRERMVSVVPARWDFGLFRFNPTGRGEKVVRGVRVWLSEKVGAKLYHGLPYMDIGQAKVVYQIEPLLAKTVPDLYEYTITVVGNPPVSEYQVSVRVLA